MFFSLGMSTKTKNVLKSLSFDKINIIYSAKS